MNKNIVYVSSFTKYPGPRYASLGPFSGEEFREVLITEIQKLGANFILNMDGVSGYGSSFLEEAFGGLIRVGQDPNVVLKIVSNIVSNDEETIKEEILGYVKEAIEVQLNG